MATTRVVRFPSKLGDDYSTVMANFYIAAIYLNMSSHIIARGTRLYQDIPPVLGRVPMRCKEIG